MNQQQGRHDETLETGAAQIPAEMAAAERLHRALADLGVVADVHLGENVALVSVCADLLVVTDGTYYRWWTGRVVQGERIYEYGPADDPAGSARTIALRRAAITAARPAACAHPV